MSAIAFQIQSSIIIFIMILGVLKAKRNRKLHIRLMSFAIAWDLILILQIELTRHAVEKAISVSNNSLLLNIHLCLAISTVVLYGYLIFLGRKILKGQNSYLPTHRKLGKITLILRILTYITSYFVV